MSEKELLKFIDREILVINGEYDNAIISKEINGWKREKRKALEVRKIITQHFSITDQERAEAVEKIKELIKISSTRLLLSSSEEDKEYARVWKTILKALGKPE